MSQVFGITMGDSSGVGPEILLKSFIEGQLVWPVVTYGDIEALRWYNDRLGWNAPLRSIESVSELRDGALNVIDAKLLSGDDITPGEINAKSGHAARQYVIAATKAALRGEIAAMVTLPMNKEATQKTDPSFVGHTELIGAVCGVDDVTIMLASDQLIVTHVSTHCSLADAIARAKQPRIKTILKLDIRTQLGP